MEDFKDKLRNITEKMVTVGNMSSEELQKTYGESISKIIEIIGYDNQNLLDDFACLSMEIALRVSKNMNNIPEVPYASNTSKSN